MQVPLKQFERLEDLQCKGLALIQSSQEYRFTTDAVILANFVREMRGKVCVEFCAGSGVISLLVAAKKRPKAVYALEIQPQLADMAERSVRLNDLQNTVKVVCGDVNRASELVPVPVDVVVCNPPYRKVGSGDRQLADNIALCRHEIAVTLRQIVENAAKILNTKGSFYLVHQSSRLCEIVELCAEYGVAVKEILPVCPKPDRQPALVVVRAVKGGQSDCKLLAPMYVTDEQGNYTDAAKAYYGLED